MDGQNDWDLAAVVRGCSNLNGNSGTQDVHEHLNGDFPSEAYDSINSLSEQSHDPGCDFSNLVTQRRYFGLEEVIDRFANGKKGELVLDPQSTITPHASNTCSLDKGDGSGGTGKDTPAPQSTIISPTSKPQQPLPSPQTGSPNKGGGLEDEKPRSQMKEVRVVEVPVEKVNEWDGWVWRKYGKKMVCDSPHSKSYYRCNYEGNKCPAKKHVQQSQLDESKYVVTYRGSHIHPPHPPPVQGNTTRPTKRRKRSRAPAPLAGKEECSFPPPTNKAA